MAKLVTELYPDIEPYDTGMLAVSKLHTIYYEQSGNKNGNPVLYLHGGPGRGTSPKDRTFFDPAVYRIILLDQRGGGKSTPAGELRENTLWDVVDDIEKLRLHLGIANWVVFGGSWGSSLALAYAESYPARPKALILRGIFMLTRREIAWLYQEGASVLFPDAWEEFLQPIPETERHDLVSAYYRRLTSDNDVEQMAAARAWSDWEMATCKLHVQPDYLSKLTTDISWATQFAKIECTPLIAGTRLSHIYHNTDSGLKNVHKIRHIPTSIIQGRYDVQCPMETVWKLHKLFPEAEFHIVPDAGHSKHEPGIQKKLVQACELYKYL